MTQSCLPKTHSHSSHCLYFRHHTKFIGQFFSIFDGQLVSSRISRTVTNWDQEVSALVRRHATRGAKVGLALTFPGLHTKTTRGGRGQDK